MTRPTHLVMDTRDGFIYSRDSSGRPFNKERAIQFARDRNSEMKPGYRNYAVFELAPVFSVPGRYTLSDDGNLVYPL